MPIYTSRPQLAEIENWACPGLLGEPSHQVGYQIQGVPLISKIDRNYPK